MERREKTEFILEQMRFLIMVAREKDGDKGAEGKKDAVVGGDADWVKVRVTGRKVSEKFLEEKENEVRVLHQPSKALYPNLLARTLNSNSTT